MVSSKISVILAVSYFTSSTSAFIATKPGAGEITALPMTSNSEETSSAAECSRRYAFVKTATTFASIASIVAGNSDFALAARSPPTKEELDRLKLGYERMSYLLDNFEQETTVCRVSITIIGFAIGLGIQWTIVLRPVNIQTVKLFCSTLYRQIHS